MGSYAVYILVRILASSLRCLPGAVALWLGRRVGDAGFLLFRKRRRIAFRNLCYAFGEAYTFAEYMRLVREGFQNMAQTGTEVLRFPLLDRHAIERVFHVQGAEHVHKAIAQGKGVALLAAHFGGWEVSSYASSRIAFPMLVLAREQKYTRLNTHLNRLRSLGGCEVIPKGFNMRKIITHLRDNGLCGILSDQDSGAKGVWVKFFGRLSSAPAGAFEIAHRTGSALLPTFIVRRPGGHHMQYVSRDITDLPGGCAPREDKDAWVQERAQAFASELEGMIRKHPGQWLWVHKRWKSSPQDRVWVFSDGKPGHLNQSLAVAERVRDVAIQSARKRSKSFDIAYTNGARSGKTLCVSEVVYRSQWAAFVLALKSRFIKPSPVRAWRWLKRALTPASFESVRGACADFFISCGARTAPVSRVLGDVTSSKTICVMKPVFPSPARFDLIIAPRHDRMKSFKGRHVLVTDTAPSRTTAQELASFREKARLRVPGLRRLRHVGLCIGGRADGYRHSAEETRQLVDALAAFARRHGWGILATTTRRTDPEIERVVEARLKDNDVCEFLVVASRENPPDAMRTLLSLSDVVVVSEDSFSMMSEALGSGRPVLVYRVQRTGKPKQAGSLDRLTGEGRLDAVGVKDADAALERILKEGVDAVTHIDRDRERIDGAIKKLL